MDKEAILKELEELEGKELGDYHPKVHKLIVDYLLKNRTEPLMILIALADRLDIGIPPKKFSDIFDEVLRLKAKEEAVENVKR